MAKGASRKLKVFQTRIGFHDIVIATASKAAALRAWGVRQDLFAQGLATVTTQPDIVEAALAHPDQPLKRPVGSTLPFSTDPGRPTITDMEPSTGPRREEKRSNPPSRPRPPPDRTRLSAAEADLAALDREHENEDARLKRELEAIEEEEDKLRTRKRGLEAGSDEKRRVWQQRRAKAEKAIERERQAYALAGGDA